MYNRYNDIDVDAVAEFLQQVVSKVKSAENPEELDEIKKIFKKNVPFTLRTYVASYLIKEATKGRHSFNRGRKEFRNESKPKFQKEFNNTHTEERPAPRPRVKIDESEASTIFISIGKNRRTYPRDLVGLLVNAGGIERDKIGDIRVLANYSFVQLFKADAEKAISTLNGYSYRGRPLSVSYSVKKDELTGNDFDAQSAEDAAAYAAAEKAAVNNEPFSSTIQPMTDDIQPSDNGYMA